jgi:hypothetical protein
MTMVTTDHIAELSSLDVSVPLQLDIISSCLAAHPGAGDYYETLIDTPHYRSSVALINLYNGQHIGEPLRIPANLEQIDEPLRLRVWRLYRNFEGLEKHDQTIGDFNSGPFARELIVDLSLPVYGASHNGGQLAEDRRICTVEDFEAYQWQGFWWRDALDDASWSFYRSNCKARRFSQEDASTCLAGRWLAYMGDSTAEGERCPPSLCHCSHGKEADRRDMLRNTLWTFLGDAYPSPSNGPMPANIPRQCDFNITHPLHPDRWTRISHIWNGHYELAGDKIGLASFRHERQIERHDQFFQQNRDIDTFLINSGLHDSWLRVTPESFLQDFDVGWRYYMKNIESIRRERVNKTTEIIYRYSNTPAIPLGGYQMRTPMNPWSMDMINLLERNYLVDYQREPEAFHLTHLDSFQVTWPWHFDNEMNDGIHYGK